MKRLKFILTILAVFTTTLCIGQQSFNANQGYANSKEYFTVIPYTEVKGKIIIEVIINNKKRKFFLDTGAPVVISESLYLELQPSLLGKIQAIDQSGAKDSLRAVSMTDIEIGGVTFNGIPAIVSRESKVIMECFGIDGFIGSNLLRNSVVQFDSKAKTITITDNPKSLKLKRKYANKMTLTAVQSNPFVWIKLKKDKHTAREKILFDTGDNGFYMLSIFAYKQLTDDKLEVFDKIAENEGSFTMGLHGTAEKSYNYAVNIPILTVNNMEFKNVSTKTTYSESSRFGSDILNYGKVTLDYKNKKFYLEPFGNKKVVDMQDRKSVV